MPLALSTFKCCNTFVLIGSKCLRFTYMRWAWLVPSPAARALVADYDERAAAVRWLAAQAAASGSCRPVGSKPHKAVYGATGEARR